jgi:TniQ/Tn7-like transposition protein D
LTSKKQGSSPHTTPSYIPQILPDELLYSFLATPAAYNSFANPREYLRIFFGAKNIIPSVDLPTSLNQLHSCLGWQYPFESAQDIIDARTIYPYHRPFLTIERHERVQNILLNGGGKGLKTLLGRVANRFGANPPLRYCARCVEADIRENRLPYWHRIHQLPAVSSCPIHGVDLFEHSWPSQAPDRQRLLLVPAVPKNRLAASGSGRVWFARISRELLEMNLPALGTERWLAAYERAAAQQGMRDTNGRIAFERFAKALRDHYGDFADFQHRERILSTPNHPLSWLRTIFGRPERSSHPVFHLLLIGFFFGSVGAFVRALDDAAKDARKEQARVRNQSSKVASAGDSGDALYRDLTISSRKLAQVLRISVNPVISRRRAMGVTIVPRCKTLFPDLRRLIENRLASGDPPCVVATHFANLYLVKVSIDRRYGHYRDLPFALVQFQ